MTMLLGSGMSYIGMQIPANMQTCLGKTALFAGEMAKHNAVLRELWVAWRREKAAQERITAIGSGVGNNRIFPKLTIADAW